jgi:hypothetical protein
MSEYGQHEKLSESVSSELEFHGFFSGKNLVAVTTSLGGGAALGLLATMLAPNSPVVAVAACLAGFATTLLASRH